MEIKELAFALTRHADDLQMFANGVSADAIGEFEQTASAIMELVYRIYAKYGEKGIPMDGKTRRFLDAIRKKIEEIRNRFFEPEEDTIEKQAREVVKNECKFLKTFFALLTGKEVIGLNSDWYDRISKYGIYGGSTIRQILDKLSEGDAERIYTAVIKGIGDGMPLNVIREKIEHEMGKTSRYLQSEIFSIINGAANDASLAFASVNKTKLMYCAVLDDKVCPDCSSRDGEIYSWNDQDIPSIPRHNNCRCRLIPVADGGKSNMDLEMDFDDYILLLSEEEQKKRLGTAKYDLWKSGEYKLKAYEQPNMGQRMSLAEVKERDKMGLKKG